MTITQQSPLTARVFLFGESDSGKTLTRSLDAQGVIGNLGPVLSGLSNVGKQEVADQVAGVTTGLLELDLDNLLLAGWTKHAELTAAARRTLASPGSREVVQLATHKVTSTHEPYVDLLFDGAPLTTVHFQLSIQFVVKAVTGTVAAGRLIDLAAGQCDVTGTLAAEGRPLLTKQDHFDLPGMVRLGAGIPLVDPASVVRAPSTAPAATGLAD